MPQKTISQNVLSYPVQNLADCDKIWEVVLDLDIDSPTPAASIKWLNFSTNSDHKSLWKHHFSWLASVNLPGMFVTMSFLDIQVFSYLHQVPAA